MNFVIDALILIYNEIEINENQCRVHALKLRKEGEDEEEEDPSYFRRNLEIFGEKERRGIIGQGSYAAVSKYIGQ